MGGVREHGQLGRDPRHSLDGYPAWRVCNRNRTRCTQLCAVGRYSAHRNTGWVLCRRAGRPPQARPPGFELRRQLACHGAVCHPRARGGTGEAALWFGASSCLLCVAWSRA